MNKTKLGRFGVLFLALVFLASCIPAGMVAVASSSWIDITDTVPPDANIIATQQGGAWTSIWHFSGGFWARTNTDPLRIYDNQLRGDIENLENLVNHTIQFEFTLPQAVTAAISEGKQIGVAMAAPEGYDYFNTAKGTPQVRIAGNTLHFQAFPRFHLVSTERYNYGLFVSGLNAFIPFVDPKYGYNGYAIFSNGNASLGSGRGFFDPNDPTRLGPPGTIHPSQIRNSSGNLVAGFDVLLGGRTYNSADVKIGAGTFVNAGAVGLVYEYILNITYYEIERDDADVAVTRIERTSYPATSVVTADVTVVNLGGTQVTTPVEFSIPDITTQNIEVTLPPGQSMVIQFTFSTPPAGPITMTAEVNKDRVFPEVDYTNNRLSVVAQIVSEPPGSSSCSDVIRWTETDFHTVRYSYSINGVSYSSSYRCHHTFSYETRLTAAHNVTPGTLKSGYGFAVNVTNSISTRLVSNSGCGSWGGGRANRLIPAPPDRAQVRLGWTVTNRRGTQPATVDLHMLSRTAAQSRFEPRQNPISEIGSKLIFTDVALAGTVQSPRTHQITIGITGGGVNGIPFCLDIRDNITINGNMYEDDATGHR